MIVFPNAKINIGLNIVAKRMDGYHDLETLFYPIPLCDALEITPSLRTTTLRQQGILLDCNTTDNLVLRAYRLLRTEYDLPELSVNLLKAIPSGAGMGGGSSDAAFMLRLINDQFELGLSISKLEDLSNQLGADCPFFIQNKPMFATGTGNVFTNIKFSLQGKHIVVVKPPIHISTKEAFTGIKPHRPTKSILSIIKQDISTWREELKNDFEASIFPIYPDLQTLKEELYQEGAIYAAMSGSGSSLYGIFDTDIKLPSRWKNYFTFQRKFE